VLPLPRIPKKDIATARMRKKRQPLLYGRLPADANNIHGATKLRRYNAPRNTAFLALAPFLSLRRKYVGKHGEIVVNIWLAFTKRSASPFSFATFVCIAVHFRAQGTCGAIERAI